MITDYILLTDPSGNDKFRFTDRFELLKDAKNKLLEYRDNSNHKFYKIQSFTYKSDWDNNPTVKTIETNI